MGNATTPSTTSAAERRLLPELAEADANVSDADTTVSTTSMQIGDTTTVVAGDATSSTIGVGSVTTTTSSTDLPDDVNVSISTTRSTLGSDRATNTTSTTSSPEGGSANSDKGYLTAAPSAFAAVLASACSMM